MNPAAILLGWSLGIATAIGLRWFICELAARERRKREQSIRRINDNIVAKNYARSELERRRQLREFTRKHGNAEVVRLTPQGPEAA